MNKISWTFEKATLLILISVTIFSCVPSRQFEDVKTANQRLISDLKNCEDTKTELNAKNAELIEEMAEVTKEITSLRKDTADFGLKYRKISELNDRLNDSFEKLLAQNKDMLQNTTIEREKLALELDKKERLLMEKEIELQNKEQAIQDKQKNISNLQSGLEEREKRVQELESMINRKDSIVNALKNKVSEALLGFNKDELTVEMRDGKVYVSLAEQLLFKSGSTDVDPKGKDALGKLADVLKKNPDIEVLIEGHTDNVPISGSARMKDNWDLSVLRATSIIRILQDRGVDPNRLMPCGRGEIKPVAANTTAEGRAKNRRTEIILSPKLDELFSILNSK